MSFVGPRPEVRKYVNHFSEDDLKILSIKPGITDYASIYFKDEAEILKSNIEPEKLYIEKILPKKLKLNKEYLNNMSLLTDIKIILKTISAIIK